MNRMLFNCNLTFEYNQACSEIKQPYWITAGSPVFSPQCSSYTPHVIVKYEDQQLSDETKCYNHLNCCEPCCKETVKSCVLAELHACVG